MRRLGLIAISVVVALGLPIESHAQITVMLKFNVNMAGYKGLGLFNPDSDAVVVRGSFMQSVNPLYNNWAGNQITLASSGGNDSVYSVTVQLANVNIGDIIQYKFVIIDTSHGQSSLTDWTDGGGLWEDNVGPAWAYGNRVDTLTSTATQSIPTVYFNNDSGTMASHNVRFQVDMTRLISAGFNHSSDTISVRGTAPPMTWSSGVILSPEISDTTLYSATVNFSFFVGSEFYYKFVAAPGGLFIDAGWDTLTNNRVLVFSDHDTVLTAVDPAIWFIGETPLAVEAAGFKAVAAVGSIELTWQTQSEINNIGFNILRGELSDNSSVLIASYNSDKALRGLGTSSTGRVYSFTDTHVASGHTYEYTVESVSSDGTNRDYPPMTVTVGEPKTFALYQNYPNPFNPSTAISYQLSAVSHVSLRVFDVLGREVATLVNEKQSAGSYSVTFDGSRLASGVYFYRLTAANFVSIRKLVLIK